MTDAELLRALDHGTDGMGQHDPLMAEAARRLRELIAEHPLVWLYGHCRAIGMTEKSDSGKPDHDIALFTVNLKAAREAAERERDKWHRNAEDWARLYDTEAIKREKYAGERDKLRKALRKLRNEAGGLAAFEDAVRTAVGNKNWSVLQQRLGEADDALAPERGKDDAAM